MTIINSDQLETIVRAMEANPTTKADAWVAELRALIPKHNWQFYANGTFCTRCGVQLGGPYADGACK